MRKQFVFIFAITVFVELSAQNNHVINAIKSNTEATAENTAKGGFDYLTLTISLLAFIIACVTLYYAIKTYHSQKKTESNTTKFSAKQERIELRYIGAQLINNAYSLYYADDSFFDDNDYCLNGRIYERMLINVDRLHADTFMGKGIDHSALCEFSILVNKYNDMLREKMRVAECRVSKSDMVTIGDDCFSSLTYNELKMTWNLFKRLYHLYNEGMLTDEERRQLKEGAQGATLPTDIPESYTIDSVLEKLGKNATFAQQCALETDLCFPYRIITNAWEQRCGKLIVSGEPASSSKSEKLLRYMLLSDESEDGKTLRDYFMTAIFCSMQNLTLNFMSEERVTAEMSVISSYVITEQGEYHAYIESYDFSLLLNGYKKGTSLDIGYIDAEQMMKNKKDLPISQDLMLKTLKPDQTIRFTTDKLNPLSTLVLVTTQGGLMHTMRIKVNKHYIDFIKKQSKNKEGEYRLGINLVVETGYILSYEHIPFDEEKYRFIQ